jgi:hypothetical protein
MNDKTLTTEQRLTRLEDAVFGRTMSFIDTVIVKAALIRHMKA